MPTSRSTNGGLRLNAQPVQRRRSTFDEITASVRPVAPEIRADELTYGVELECLIPVIHERQFPRGGYHEGERSPILPRGWEGRWDRSIQTEAGYYTLELVSPVMNGASGIEQIREVMGVLNAHGVRVNNSCGYHVHIGAQGMEKHHVEAMKAVFRHYESAFFGTCGTRIIERLTGRGWEYCKTHPEWGGDWDRRQSLNTSNWVSKDMRKNTIEVRCFSAGMDALVLVGATLMTIAMGRRTMLLAGGELGIFNSPIERPDVAMAAFLDLFFQDRYLPIPAIMTDMYRDALTIKAAEATAAMLEAIATV